MKSIINIVKEASRESTVIPCAFCADVVVAYKASLTLGPDITDAGCLGTHGVPASKPAYTQSISLECQIRRPEYRVLVQLFQSSIALYFEYPKDFSDRGVILYLGVVIDRTLNMNRVVHINPGAPKTLGSSIP